MRVGAAALTCAVCAGAAGCNNGSDPGAQIRATFARYETAVASGNSAIACQSLSASIRRQLAIGGAPGSPSQSCPLTLGQQLLAEDRVSRARQAELAATLSVRVLSVRGGRAAVLLYDRVGSLTETGGAVAVLEAGKWRIAQLPTRQTAGRFIVYRMPSAAMSPTLKPGEVVLADPTAYRHRAPAVGDVVLFHPPANSEVGCVLVGEGITISGVSTRRMCGVPGRRSATEIFIKRIVAGPGDVVTMRSGRMIRNGVAEVERFSMSCTTDLGCLFPRPVRIPRGSWFVVGDNRAESADSREWGPIRTDWIVAKLVRVVR